jgi:hypothetical protein
MRVLRLFPVVACLGVLSAGCSNSVSTAPTPLAQVVVVGANAAPGGLPGFVINQGTPGAPQIPQTCAALVCYQTIQIQNTGIACANNINGQTQVFIAPASSPNLVRNSSSGFLITGNPALQPGQIATVTVTIPEQPPVPYVDILVMNWTSGTCS